MKIHVQEVKTLTILQTYSFLNFTIVGTERGNRRRPILFLPSNLSSPISRLQTWTAVAIIIFDARAHKHTHIHTHSLTRTRIRTRTQAPKRDSVFFSRRVLCETQGSFGAVNKFFRRTIIRSNADSCDTKSPLLLRSRPRALHEVAHTQ